MLIVISIQSKPTMKNLFILFLSITMLSFKGIDHPSLPIGASAPDFNLKGTDGKMYTLKSFSKARILVIIFTCNHCPTAQAYESRIKKLVTDYKDKGVQIVAISPNDPKSIRLDELGYTEYSDSYEEMKLRAKEKGFNFPYLYDGDTEETSKKYGPVATPHVFIFDEKRVLRYSGRIDNVEKPTETPQKTDTRNAINALLEGKAVPVETTKTFGCSIKWAEKQVLGKQEKDEWAKEAVSLDLIDEEGLRNLVKNDSDKLRVINVWASWCGPCVAELPDFMNINHMYRNRDFEFITVSADKPEKQAKALAILKRMQISAKNYLFNSGDAYKLIELIDPKWQGALPYTLIIEPKGKVVYGKQGPIKPIEIKKLIVEHPLIGRYF